MAEIDKLIAKGQGSAPGGQGPVPAAPPAQRGGGVAARSAAPVARGGRAALTTWVRVGLGVMVAAGVALAWPYAHRCGLSLYGYLAASGGVVLAGLWGAVTSWARRMGLAQVISLLVTLTGGVLVAKTILDRTGYPKQPSTWSCSAP
jgi:hypothetical protein